MGASTGEAQIRVAEEAAEIISAIFEGKVVRGAVNMPRISPEVMKELAPYVEVASNIASLAVMLSQTNEVTSIDIDYVGDIANYDSRLLKANVVKGLLAPITEDTVNLVNYEAVAKNRGLVIKEHKDPNAKTNLVRVRLKYEAGEIVIEGMVGHDGPRVVGINEFRVGFPLNGGKMLFIENEDRPGMVGKVSTLLGNLGINISNMSLAENGNGAAMMAILLNQKLDKSVIQQLQAIPGIYSAKFVSLPK